MPKAFGQSDNRDGKVMDYLRRYDIDSATARKDIRSFTETLEKNGILER